MCAEFIHNNRARTVTYKRIKVKYFHDYLRWVVSNALWLAVNLDRVKDKRLVPSGTHCLLEALCCLTVVEKHDSCKRICIQIHPLFAALPT